MRDTLYHGLPNSFKTIFQSRLQNMDITKELSMTQVKAEMDKTLQWLTPIATNTTKNNNEFGDSTGKESNLIRLQTLYYAKRNKIDSYIIELLTCLNHLVTFVRYRHHSGSSNGIKPNQGKGNTLTSRIWHITREFPLFPIMAAWTFCTPLVGIYSIIHHYSSIFKAISPHYIFHFFWRNGKAGWLLLGGTVFCITGIWEAQMPSGNWLITQSCQREIKASCCGGFGWMG
ncbi:protein PSK SIMULATOR 1-like isoform X1 [Arachis hypogaea]|uniref:protein PSK SIMULATOR 1-like isoform X1 n=1 Tax=Arachis hypogaea TaxID=3818 RepID=UPI003B221659